MTKAVVVVVVVPVPTGLGSWEVEGASVILAAVKAPHRVPSLAHSAAERGWRLLDYFTHHWWQGRGRRGRVSSHSPEVRSSGGASLHSDTAASSEQSVGGDEDRLGTASVDFAHQDTEVCDVRDDSVSA